MKKTGIIWNLLFSLVIFSQKDIQFTHVFYTHDYFNVASAAYDKAIRATIITRQQWFDFQGAPQIQLASFSMPYKSRFGLTSQLLHDKLGYENNFSLTLGGTYYFPVVINENEYRLGIGLAANIYVKRLEGSKLIYDDMSDPNGIFTDVTRAYADANMGCSFSGKNVFVGLSTRNVVSVPKSKESIFKYNRNFYIFAKYNFPLNEQVELTPSYFGKTNVEVWEHNVQVQAWFEKAFMVGLNYRLKESLGMLLGVRFLKHWEVAYAYDLIVGSIKDVSFGSHDIVLHYYVKPKPPKLPYIKSPRYFN